MPIKRPKHLLIIGGGVFQVPAIKTAKFMGLKVVVTDYNREAEGMLLADYPIEVSTRNIILPSILPNSSTGLARLME